MTNIDLWKKHLLENPMEVIEVVAVLAATSPYLTIEEDMNEHPQEAKEFGTSSTHGNQSDSKESQESNKVSEQSTSEEDSDGGSTETGSDQ